MQKIENAGGVLLLYYINVKIKPTPLEKQF